jgi:hypothetical protein
MVSKQMLNPSSWCIWSTKNRKKWIRNEKIMALQSRGAQEHKTTNHNQFLNTQKLPYMLFYCYYNSKIILNEKEMINFWALKVGVVQIEEKIKMCFVNMKVFFFNSHWFFFFSNSKTNIWAMKAKLMNLFNHQCK